MKQPKSKPAIKTTERPSHEEMTISPHPKYAHYTKFEWDCDFTGNLSNPPNCAFHEITEHEIDTCDTSRLIQYLKADPDNLLVKVGPGELVLSVKCNPDHPSDVLTKPEFRAFVKKAEQQGVCWIYFAKPGSGILNKFLAAGGSGQIKEITKNSIEITCSAQDLYVFFINQFRRFYSLCNMAGISLGAANAHLKALIEPLFPMIQVVPLSSTKVPEPPQWLIDAYRRVNPRYVPGKSMVRSGEMIREIFLAEYFRSESK